MPVWLLVDCNFLGYRALYTTGGLSHGGASTGVAYGVLQTLENLTDLHGAERVILAFDGGGSGLRGEIFPGYKASRANKERTPEEQIELDNFHDEMQKLRHHILPEIGYNNVIKIKGYEADDIIAGVAENLPRGVEGVIVSADHDLLQCLGENVICHNPTTRKVTTLKSFVAQWGVLPCQWATVKAWAGCTTDDIPGIAGVGEITAAKFVTGKLKPSSKAYQNIVNNLDVYNRNIGLVKLPFPGLKLPDLVEDSVTPAKFMRVRDSLGIRSRVRADRKGGFDV